jgi:hypothetical protein
MADVGMDAYRFSISWSRIFPGAHFFVTPTIKLCACSRGVHLRNRGVKLVSKGSRVSQMEEGD